jgi:hypothetical protein
MSATSDEGTIVSLPGFFRVAGMLEELRDEIRQPVLDEAARARLRVALDAALAELHHALSPDLIEEYERLRSRLEGPGLSVDELRVSYAELVGWLHGVLGLARVTVSVPDEVDTSEKPET